MASRHIQAAVVGTGRGGRAYTAAAAVVGRALVAGIDGAGAWVRGGAATGDIVPGVSDLDLVVVVPDGRRGAVERRRRWLRGPVTVTLYEQRELAAAVGAPLTFITGMEDELWLRTRPGLYGPFADWGWIAGSAELPSPPERDAQAHRFAAWLELQWWWRHAVAACVDPDRAHVPWLLVKLAVEPVRINAWLDGRRRMSRLDAIEDLDSQARDAARAVLRDPLRAPAFAALLGACADGSRRVAAQLAASVNGSTDVRLVGSDRTLLLDSRALARPPRPVERMAVRAASLGDRDAIAAAVRHTPADGSEYVVLHDGDLALVPTDRLWEHGWLRTLQCPTSDPATFAQLDGDDVASFPDLEGWSAADVAARTLNRPPGARIQHLARTLASGRPELPLD